MEFCPSASAEDLEAPDGNLLGPCTSSASSSPSTAGTLNLALRLPSISNMDCTLQFVFMPFPTLPRRPRAVTGPVWSPSQLVLSRSSWSNRKSSPPGSARGKGCTCRSHRVLITAWHGCARAACKRHKVQQGLPYGLRNNVYGCMVTMFMDVWVQCVVFQSRVITLL